MNNQHIAIAPNPLLRAQLLAAAGGVFISLAALFVKLIAPLGMGPSIIGAWRTLIATILLCAIVTALDPTAWRRIRVNRFAVGAGVLVALDLFVWHRSILLSGAGIATILGNTQVFWTTVGSVVLLGERPPRHFLLACALAFVGVCLLVGVGSDVVLSPDYIRGVAWGLATGVVYASYILTLRQAQGASEESPRGRMLQSAVLLTYVSAVCSVGLFAMAAVEGETITPPTPGAWILLAGLAIFPQVLGWLSISLSLRSLPPSRAALFLLMQPTFATLWGALWLGERLLPLQLFGAFLTLFAIYKGSTR